MAPAYYIESTKTMYVAFAGRIEYRALLCIEEALRCNAIPCMTSTSALAGALNRMREMSARTDHYFERSFFRGNRSHHLKLCGRPRSQERSAHRMRRIRLVQDRGRQQFGKPVVSPHRH
jgi:hypothetical protein